ncbi:hypothetical protein EYF80_017109 [Liparis tanakae]|uniref:Uncharacterized protein n=1 Tax=Liparis tanakae TaxID=230148 RepID=A0A4Z2I4B5_9TELE|nr:hypothetical protein EYF80_017109 [Liparis tanakae]
MAMRLALGTDEVERLTQRAEWIYVIVTGSPRTLGMPEVTDTQSALIQAQKPTKVLLASNKVRGVANPAQLITSHHKERQERESKQTVKRCTLKWLRDLA